MYINCPFNRGFRFVIMELKYVVMTIVKILISVPPAILITTTKDVHSAALMGGHLDNKNATAQFEEYELYDEKDISQPNPTVSCTFL